VPGEDVDAVAGDLPPGRTIHGYTHIFLVFGVGTLPGWEFAGRVGGYQ